MIGRARSRYNSAVRRRSIPNLVRSLSPVIVPTGLMLLALVLAPSTLAADPQGAGQAGYGAAGGSGAYDPGADRAIPYIAALLVTSAGLSVVGFVAMRAGRRPAATRRRLDDAWWRCAGCQSRNAVDRRTCFACGDPRGTPPPAARAAPAEGAGPEEPAHNPAEPAPAPPPVGDAYSA
jgi:hypothetical protein